MGACAPTAWGVEGSQPWVLAGGRLRVLCDCVELGFVLEQSARPAGILKCPRRTLCIVHDHRFRVQVHPCMGPFGVQIKQVGT